MGDVINNGKEPVRLHIAFPKSSEDHRLQLAEINGSIFAIVHSPLESQGPIRLYCENWSLVLLAPIRSKTNVFISGINVICLNEILSEEGNVNLHASHRLVHFAHMIKPPEKSDAAGEAGVFRFSDDPGALLHYYRQFEGIVGNVRIGSPDAIKDAQQKFIMNLCTLADKVEHSEKNLDLRKVLGLWNISYLPL